MLSYSARVRKRGILNGLYVTVALRGTTGTQTVVLIFPFLKKRNQKLQGGYVQVGH